MSYKNFETYPIFLTTLTPIHIGCGDVYEPTNFVVDAAEQKLYSFDPSTVKLSSDQLEDLNTVLYGASLVEIYDFYLKNIDLYKAAARAVVPYDKRAESKFKISSDDHQIKNDQVFRQCYCETKKYQVPYIPGSSLKGAVHTALLDRLSQKYETELKEKRIRRYKDVDEYFLGREAKFSPMRLLSISDFHIPKDRTVEQKIIMAERVSKFPTDEGDEKEKRGKKGGGIKSAFEVIQKGQFRCFEGCLTIREKHKRDTNTPDHNYHSLQEVFSDLNNYSRPEFEEEIGYWEQEENGGYIWMTELRDLLHQKRIRRQLDEGNIALIRIGENTGARNLTLQDKELFRVKEATTMFVAMDQDHRYPFGWALLESSNSEVGDIIDRRIQEISRYERDGKPESEEEHPQFLKKLAQLKDWFGR